MALDKLTKIDGGGISTTSDYRVGVITATKFVGPVEGSITATDASFSGNVSIAGTLTYEDVTNVDSVGILTARTNIILGDSLKHLGDENTLISFPANDTITAHTSGSERLRITNQGYVGINEISPIHQLSIGINTTTAWAANKNISNTTNNDFIGLNVDNHNSGSNPEVGIMLQAGASGSGQYTINCRKSGGNAADLIFRTRDGGIASKEVLRITSTGDVGIGSDSTGGARLRVFDNGTNTLLQQWRTYLGSTAGERPLNLYSPATDSFSDYFRFQTGNSIKFQIDSIDALCIEDGGNIGIGTDDPGKLLEIFGTDPTIKLRDSSGDAYALIEGDSADQGSLRFRADPLGAGSDTHIRFDTDGVEALRIASDGVITGRAELRLTEGTSGTTNGDEIGSLMYLHPATNNKNAKIVALHNGGSSGADLAFFTRTQADATNNDGGEERLRITSTGRIGINQSNPSTNLDVSGNIKLTGQLFQSTPADFWSQGNTFIELNGVGNLTHMGSYETCLTSNGYRDNNAQWVSYAINSKAGASQIRLNPAGYIIFGTESTKSTGSAHNVTERFRITTDGKLAYNHATGASTIADVDIRSNNGIHLRGENGNTNNVNIYLGGSRTNQRKTAIIHDPVGGYCRGDLHFCLENTADLSDVDVTDSKMVIKADGKVGIGSAAPKTDLDIANNAGGTLTLSCSDDSSSANQLIGKINFYTADPSGDGPQNNAIISAHSVTNTGSGAYLKFSTATGATGTEGADAVERLRITSGGQTLFTGVSGTTPLDIKTSNSNNNTVQPIIEAYTDNDSRKAQIALARESVSKENGWVFLTSTNADSTSQERLRIASDGKVGIGSAIPAAKLDVFATGGTIAQFGDPRSASFECLRIKNNVASYPAISQDSTHDTLDLRSMGSVQATIDSNNNDTGNYFRVMANGEGGAGTEIFRVQENGCVGIGTASIATNKKLDICNGIVSLQGSGSHDSRIEFVRPNTGSLGWVGIPNWNPDGFYIYVPTATSNEAGASYGDGTWNFFSNGVGPRLKILSSGNVQLTQNIRLESAPNGTWGAGLNIGGNGQATSSTHGSMVVTNGNLHLDSRDGSYGVYLNWYGGGNGTYFGNGAGSQRGRIDGAGNLSLSGSYPGSDLRLKENIQNISGATDTIKSLVGKTFTWKTEAGLDDWRHYGFIAQEVQTVAPDLVKPIGCHYFDEDDKLVDIEATESDEDRKNKGITQSLTVNNEGVTPILVEAMKELIAKVETLEAKVSALEGT